MDWNDRMGGYFGHNDLVGFGDADEIPSSRNVLVLRHCDMAGPSVDIGSWFAWGRVDRAFRPDWPVPGHPWTLGDPTYWTLRSALAYSNGSSDQFPSRMRGTSGHYLLGGVHMTDNPYPPFLLAKSIACTECGEEGSKLFQAMHDCFVGSACEGLDDKGVIQKLMQMLDRSVHQSERMAGVRDGAIHMLGEAYYVPWYIECYPRRFPGWFGGVDARLLG